MKKKQAQPSEAPIRLPKQKTDTYEKETPFYLPPGDSGHSQSQYGNGKEQPPEKRTGNKVFHRTHGVVPADFFDVCHIEAGNSGSYQILYSQAAFFRTLTDPRGYSLMDDVKKEHPRRLKL